MSGEATLTPDDGSEEILIGKGDQVEIIMDPPTLTAFSTIVSRLLLEIIITEQTTSPSSEIPFQPRSLKIEDSSFKTLKRYIEE